MTRQNANNLKNCDNDTRLPVLMVIESSFTHYLRLIIDSKPVITVPHSTLCTQTHDKQHTNTLLKCNTESSETTYKCQQERHKDAFILLSFFKNMLDLREIEILTRCSAEYVKHVVARCLKVTSRIVAC
jgi:hypothetical protein